MVQTPPPHGDLVILEEFNGTMYWVDQTNVSYDPPQTDIRICLSTDGVNWLTPFNNT